MAIGVHSCSFVVVVDAAQTAAPKSDPGAACGMSDKASEMEFADRRAPKSWAGAGRSDIDLFF